MRNVPEIVAELGASHCGNPSQAITLIEEAAKAGADTIKLQIYDPAEMVLDPFFIVEQGPWQGHNLLRLYEAAHTPVSWVPAIKARCKELKLEWFASVFSKNDIEKMEDMECPRYKIASCENTDLELIEEAANTGKPIIISTGLASLSEIRLACSIAMDAGLESDEITLLACSAAYPASDNCEDKINELKSFTDECFDVGLSDHTKGIEAAINATRLGARMIEKHIKMPGDDSSLDSIFACEPDMFALMRQACRAISSGEDATRKLRRSLWIRHSRKAGHVLLPGDIVTARPNLGAHPHRRNAFVGKILRHAITGPTPLTDDLVE